MARCPSARRDFPRIEQVLWLPKQELNKDDTVDMLIWTGQGVPLGPLPSQRTPDNEGCQERGKQSSPGKNRVIVQYQVILSVNIHTRSIQTEHVFMHLGIYAYIHTYVIPVHEKIGHKFDRVRWGIWETLKGRKGRRNNVIVL